MRSSSQGQPYTVSFFGQIALVAAVFMFMVSTTFGPAEISSFFIMLFFLIFGIVLSYTMVGIRFIPFNWSSLMADVITTTISFFAMFYMNRIIPAEIGISPLGETAFGILAGVSEEWFFRLWLCAWIHKVTKSMLIAVPSSAFAWAIFHLARYGGNPNLIWIIFMVGLPLGALTLIYRNADGPTFAHMLVNAIARRG